MEHKWEIINQESAKKVRRLRIDGGYLYQVQTDSKCTDYNLQRYEAVFGETTFVPFP